MSIRGHGRWLLWICGAGAIAALVTAVVSWKDIVVHYHLEQLRLDPASLPSFLDASAGAAKMLAARAFAREPQGREVVVSLFVDYFAKARAQPSLLSSQIDNKELAEVERAIVGFHGWDKVSGILMFWGWLRWRDASESGGFVLPDDKVLVTWEGQGVLIDPTRLVGLAELLAECSGASLDPPHYPGLTVEVLSIESALDRVKSWTAPLEFLRGRYLRPVDGAILRGLSGASVDGSIPSQSFALLLTRIVP